MFLVHLVCYWAEAPAGWALMPQPLKAYNSLAANFNFNYYQMKYCIRLVGITFLSFFYLASFSQNKYIHPEGKFITVNGAKLWIESLGKGEPLFMIAGGPGNSHVNLHVFDTLKNSCQLIFIDNFGRGKSDTAAHLKEYSVSRDVEDIEGIRKALGFEKISIYGQSYGTVVAQLYAVKYAHHLKKLIIESGFYNAKMWQENDDNSNRQFAEQDPELWDSLMVLRKKGYRSSDSLHYTLYAGFHIFLVYAYCPDNKRFEDNDYPNNYNTRLYYQLVGHDADFHVGNDIAKFDVTAQLKYLKMPILIMAGRYDRVSVPKFSVLYKKYCPQAKFVMFEKSGHNQELEEPGETFALISQFLLDKN